MAAGPGRELALTARNGELLTLSLADKTLFVTRKGQ